MLISFIMSKISGKSYFNVQVKRIYPTPDENKSNDNQSIDYIDSTTADKDEK